MPAVANRVVKIFRKQTSMRFTAIEWDAINTICSQEHISRKTLFELIDMNHDTNISLSASIRLFTIIYYKNTLTQTHKKYIGSDFSNPIFEAIKEIA